MGKDFEKVIDRTLKFFKSEDWRWKVDGIGANIDDNVIFLKNI